MPLVDKVGVLQHSLKRRGGQREGEEERVDVEMVRYCSREIVINLSALNLTCPTSPLLTVH